MLTSALRSRNLVEAWDAAVGGNHLSQSEWRTAEGGLWRWERDGPVVQNCGAEWVGLSWSAYDGSSALGLTNMVIELTVGGRAEAAGISFGPYKDFLANLRSTEGPCRLQLEVDVNANRWALRVDGRLMQRSWWDSGVHSVQDLLAGTFGLKARYAQSVYFRDIGLHPLDASCRLSVIIPAYRFLQRLRVCLRAWCHQSLPSGEYEVVVVNPDSPDGTHEHLAAVARSYPHIRMREFTVEPRLATNKGAMINRAVRVSIGEWIWLTDADCLFSTDSAAMVLNAVQGLKTRLFYGQRRHLSGCDTDALLSGRSDALKDFDLLVRSATINPTENDPWGYTQIVHRSVLERVGYRENINHFAHSDDIFVRDCARLSIVPEQIEGLICLHLDHPFSWYGTSIPL